MPSTADIARSLFHTIDCILTEHIPPEYVPSTVQCIYAKKYSFSSTNHILRSISCVDAHDIPHVQRSRRRIVTT